MRGASPPDASGVFAFVVSFCSVLRKMHWASLHLCFFCVIFCGEGTAPPRQMHWVSLHVLFLLLFFVFFLCFFFVMFLEAMWQREEATFEKKGWRGVGGEGWGVFACVVFFCHFCLLLLVFFLRDVLGSTVAVRGGNLLVSTVFFATVPACRGFFVSVSTDARGTRGWLRSGGEHWPYMIAADVQRIIPA